MTKTKTITLYSFDELNEEQKQKAIDNLRDINVDYPDWSNIDYDSELIGLKIIELQDHRPNKGEFITSAKDCANAILKEHGEQCETYKTAKSFLDEYLPLEKEWTDNEDNDGFPFEYENQACELSEEFLKSLLEDYRIMQNKDYEYLTSDESIIETIKANEYLFNANGKIETP